MGNDVTTTAIDRGLDAYLAADLAATSFTLAKRFAAGATMWSIAPGWEPHALHIAVEFIHPSGDRGQAGSARRRDHWSECS